MNKGCWITAVQVRSTVSEKQGLPGGGDSESCVDIPRTPTYEISTPMRTINIGHTCKLVIKLVFQRRSMIHRYPCSASNTCSIAIFDDFGFQACLTELMEVQVMTRIWGRWDWKEVMNSVWETQGVRSFVRPVLSCHCLEPRCLLCRHRTQNQEST